MRRKAHKDPENLPEPDKPAEPVELSFPEAVRHHDKRKSRWLLMSIILLALVAIIYAWYSGGMHNILK
jgi:hypothetical protein